MQWFRLKEYFSFCNLWKSNQLPVENYKQQRVCFIYFKNIVEISCAKYTTAMFVVLYIVGAILLVGMPNTS